MRRWLGIVAVCAVLAAALPASAPHAAGRAQAMQILADRVTALKRILGQTPRDRTPMNWASLQNHLGLALHALGRAEPGTGRLVEAVAAFQAALEERRRDRVPVDWAITTSNLAHSLTLIGEREHDRAQLADAVARFDAALAILGPHRAPADWARAIGGQGLARLDLAQDRSDLAQAERALAQIDQASATLGALGKSPLAQPYRARRGEAMALIAGLRKQPAAPATR